MGPTLTSEAVVENDVSRRVLSSDEGREAVEAILQQAKATASDMIRENRQIVEALRDALIWRRELVGDEIAEVIRQAQDRPPEAPQLAAATDGQALLLPQRDSA
jgi:ATP-dependent Zn protease